MMALADLDDILIKMSYIADCSTSSLVSVSLDYAEPYGTGAQALEVEHCQCPPGYTGTSCEVQVLGLWQKLKCKTFRIALRGTLAAAAVPSSDTVKSVNATGTLRSVTRSTAFALTVSITRRATIVNVASLALSGMHDVVCY